MRKYCDICILALLIGCYIVIFSSLSILRHDAFASYFDLTNMDNTIWNTIHGHFFSLRFGQDYVSRLSIHADFILILLSPIYLIWDNIRMLLITQSVFLALGAIPTYLLAKSVLKSKLIALLFAFVYLINPGLEWTNIYDFHGVALAIPFFLSAFYSAYIRQWKWFAVFIVLALFTKEEISLDIAMLGLAICFVWKERVIGLVTAGIGLLWFLLMVYVIIPHFSASGVDWALNMYNPLFSKPITTIAGSKLHLSSLQVFYSDQAIAYYIALLKPLAFLPLIGFPWLMLSLPEFLINLLSDNPAMRSITFHYDSGITPSLFIAAIFGMQYVICFVEKNILLSGYRRHVIGIMCVVLLTVAIRVNYHYSPLPITPSCWCFNYTVTKEDTAFEKALQRIPPDASITASIEVRSHINHREYVWFVPTATQSAQYIALITQNRIVGNYEPKILENELIPVLLRDRQYKVDFKSQHFYLFEKRSIEVRNNT